MKKTIALILCVFISLTAILMGCEKKDGTDDVTETARETKSFDTEGEMNKDLGFSVAVPEDVDVKSFGTLDGKDSDMELNYFGLPVLYRTSKNIYGYKLAGLGSDDFESAAKIVDLGKIQGSINQTADGGTIVFWSSGYLNYVLWTERAGAKELIVQLASAIIDEVTGEDETETTEKADKKDSKKSDKKDEKSAKKEKTTAASKAATAAKSEKASTTAKKS
ncbi:MAG: hypothetical protein K6F09_04735 [Clostridiales bacterium]|nr:hypothetical protein [Clostridiales bacterium]